MSRRRRSASDLELRRHALIARAELERAALRDATQDLQVASDWLARIAIIGITVVRRYWLPAGLVLTAALFKRAGPIFRVARTGIVVLQAVKLLRAVRH